MVSQIKYILFVICFGLVLVSVTGCTTQKKVETKTEVTIDKTKQDAEGIIQTYLENKYPGITVYSVYRPCSSGLAPMTNEDGSWTYEALTNDYLSKDGDTDSFTFTVYRDENRCVTKVKMLYRAKNQEISDEFEP